MFCHSEDVKDKEVDSDTRLRRLENGVLMNPGTQRCFSKNCSGRLAKLETISIKNVLRLRRWASKYLLYDHEDPGASSQFPHKK